MDKTRRVKQFLKKCLVKALESLGNNNQLYL